MFQSGESLKSSDDSAQDTQTIEVNVHNAVGSTIEKNEVCAKNTDVNFDEIPGENNSKVIPENNISEKYTYDSKIVANNEIYPYFNETNEHVAFNSNNHKTEDKLETKVTAEVTPDDKAIDESKTEAVGINLTGENEVLNEEGNKTEDTVENKVVPEVSHDNNVVKEIKTEPYDINATGENEVLNEEGNKTEDTVENKVTPEVTPDNKTADKNKENADTIKQKDTDLKWFEPLGFPNLNNNCYLNSVIQVLFVCENFCDKIVEYALNNCKDDAEDINKQFVIDLANLLKDMKERWYHKTRSSYEKFSKYFILNNGDDIQKCFQQIVSRVNKETRTVTSPQTESESKAEESFNKYKSRNDGFIFDLFYSQISYTVKCEGCSKIWNEHFQLLNVFPVPIPGKKENVKLSECLQIFLDKSSIQLSDEDKKCCENPSLWSYSQITHVPTCVLIYVIRGSYNPNDDKNRTNVVLDDYFFIPTKSGPVSYSLKATFDHIGVNEFGHYYCKCLHDNQWLLINDTQVEKIRFDDVQSKNSVGFLLQKCSSDPIQLQSTNSSLVSVLQMLFSCKEFKIVMLNFLNNCKTTELKGGNRKIYDLAQLMKYLEYKDHHGCKKYIDAYENYYLFSSDGNEIFAVYSKIMHLFDHLKLPRSEVINDLFLMKVNTLSKCQNCSDENDVESIFPCIFLNLEKESEEVNLEEAIKKYFGTKFVKDKACCESPSRSSSITVLEPPKYILIDVKGNYHSLNYDQGILIGEILYNIRAVFCNEDGNYNVRCLHNRSYWLFDEKGALPIADMYCPSAVAFMLAHSEVEKIEDLNAVKDYDLLDYDDIKSLENVQNYGSLESKNSINNVSSEEIKKKFTALIGQALYSCDEFKETIINVRSRPNLETEDHDLFHLISDLCTRFNEMDQRKTPGEKISIKHVNNCDTIHECYESMLSVLSGIKLETTLSELSDGSAVQYNGFICRNFFYGNIEFERRCNICSTSQFKSSVSIFSMPLKKKDYGVTFTLQQLIDNYLMDMEHIMTSNIKEYICCKSPNIVSKISLKNAPKHLLCYMTKKDNCNVTIDDVDDINIGGTKYKIKSIILCHNDIYSVSNILSDNIKRMDGGSNLLKDMFALMLERCH